MKREPTESSTLTSTPKKRGRPEKPYRTSWGDHINGLRYRQHDRRWLVVATGQMYREPDERLAIAKFHELQSERKKPLKVEVEVGTFPDPLQATLAGLQAWGRGHKDVRLKRNVQHGGTTTVTVGKEFDTPAYWNWLNQKLVSDAKWVSQRVGIDLTNLKPPPPSVKLSTLIETYTSKPNLSSNETSRSKLFWSEFCKAVGVPLIREVGHDQIIAYEKAVQSAGLSTKSVLHRYAKIKTVLAYAMKRGLDIEGCRRALDAAALLESGHRNENDPKPIDPVAFWKVFEAAERKGDDVFKAILLVSLNGAMYSGEVSALKWQDIDLKTGTLVCRRPKTGVSRVAVLWRATVEALAKVDPVESVPTVFSASRRSFTSNAVLKKWREYREAAGFDNLLTFGQIRDAAYSIACQSASLDQARALAGHRFPGMSDAYVRRRPDFVEGACEAIRAAFQVDNKVKTSRAGRNRR